MQVEVKSSTRHYVCVEGSIQQSVPAEEVWKIITEPSHLINFHPFCKKHVSSGFSKVGDKDEAVYHKGGRMQREVTAFESGRYYKLHIIGEKGGESDVHFHVEQVANDTSLFRVKIESYAFRNVPRFFWRWIYRKRVTVNLKNYVNSLLMGVCHYSTTGKRIKPDQFGTSSMFSAE